MQKRIFTLCICMMMFQLWAQGNYYIYLQTEDGRPFYAKSGAKIFESSGNGYLIIPDLTGQESEFTIGFPDQPGIEWKFKCSTEENDQAYILRTSKKNKPLELSILKQGKNITGTKVVVEQSQKSAVSEKKATGIVSDDTFSSMLAQVVSDPTIRQQPVIIPKPGDSLNIVKVIIQDSAKTSIATTITKPPEIKKDVKSEADSNEVIKVNTIPAVSVINTNKPETKPTVGLTKKHDSIETKTKAVTDTPKVNNASLQEIKEEKQLIPALKTQDTPIAEMKNTIVTSANIKRTLQRKSKEGIELIYIDELSDGSKDTIRILIPVIP